MDFQHSLQQAAALQAAGRLAEAEQACLGLLNAMPGFFQARHLLGIVWLQQGRGAEALSAIDTALAAAPGAPAILASRGLALQALGRLDQALDSFDLSLAAAPENPRAWYNRGSVLRKLKRPEQALASYDRALALKPRDTRTLNSRGKVLRELRRFEEALAGFDAALAIKPGEAEFLANRGITLALMGRHDEALADYERALVLAPGDIGLMNNRGLALRGLHRFAEALNAFETALAVKPDFLDARINHGVTLWELGHYSEALASLDEAHGTASAELLHNRGNVLFSLKRFGEAAADFEAALALDPDHRFAFGSLAGAALNACDWRRTARIGAEIALRPDAIIPPLTVLGYSGDPALLLRHARANCREKIPAPPPPLWAGVPYRHDKIRLAYLSADFHEHATAHLAAGLFERHDRSRFEVSGISYGPDDGSQMRARLAGAFDRFIDVAGLDNSGTARMLREMEIDIAIDLKGYTLGARPEILSFRPVPVQVNYLGYPGTMGAPFIDYVIADRIVAPFDQQEFFDERIVHLPDSYQPNDSARAIAEQTPPRAEVGLPQSGFVFCCFNNSWKITAAVFDVWMRLLRDVPQSVLWLLDDNADAVTNLRREAAARGIDAARLVFAPRTTAPAHLARHRLADLFLDTLPCNAHTTASDALWAGLPVLTCLGDAFPGRVAASLLQAAGLGEFATGDLRAYETLALKLAREPHLLAGARNKLENPRALPLFDTARLRRHIEAAFTRMWQIAENGEKPRSFAIEAI